MNKLYEIIFKNYNTIINEKYISCTGYIFCLFPRVIFIVLSKNVLFIFVTKNRAFLKFLFNFRFHLFEKKIFDLFHYFYAI